MLIEQVLEIFQMFRFKCFVLQLNKLIRYRLIVPSVWWITYRNSQADSTVFVKTVFDEKLWERINRKWTIIHYVQYKMSQGNRIFQYYMKIWNLLFWLTVKTTEEIWALVIIHLNFTAGNITFNYFLAFICIFSIKCLTNLINFY